MSSPLLKIVVGQAGVGKSLLINCLTGGVDAVVEEDMFKDGTKNVTLHGDEYLDTMGMNSVHHKLTLEAIKAKVIEGGFEAFVIVLVLNKNEGRQTEFLIKLKSEFMDALTHPNLVIVWTHKYEKTSPKFQAVMKRAEEFFGAGLLHQFEADLCNFKDTFKQVLSEDRFENSFKSTAAPIVTAPKLPVPIKDAITSVGHVDSVKAATIPVKVPVLKIHRTRMNFTVMDGLTGDKGKGSVHGMFTALDKLKSSDGGTHIFKRHAQLGDAYLRSVVYNHIEENNILPAVDVTETATDSLGNGETQVMATFFNQFAPASLKGKLVNGGGFLGSHSKAQYVEALIHYAAKIGTKAGQRAHNYIVRWIVNEGMKRVVANGTGNVASLVVVN